MTSILGLPAHPLFAHIPVVLIPLAAIGAVLMLWPRLRDRVGWFVVAIVFVAGIACQLAISSGQQLRRYVQETRLMREHVHMGESIRPWVLLMFLALVGVMLLARPATNPGRAQDTDRDGVDHPSDGPRRDGWKVAGVACAVASILFSAMATYTIFRIGHSGSKAVWQPTQTKIDHGVTNREHERGDG
jgi:hypothetical protein